MITGFPSKTSNSHIKIYKETLKSQEWLNDKHISAAQCLLQCKEAASRYEWSRGSDIAVGHNCEFVQCLNLAHNHWIMVSTVGCVSGVVNVLDSLQLGLSMSVKRTIANLRHTDKHKKNNFSKQTKIVVQEACK